MTQEQKRPRGRPARPYPRIPDTFENVVKALVKPVKDDTPTKEEDSASTSSETAGSKPTA